MITAKDLITGEEKSFSDLLLENIKMNRLVEELEEMLKGIIADSGFRCLSEELQDKILENL